LKQTASRRADDIEEAGGHTGIKKGGIGEGRCGSRRPSHIEGGSGHGGRWRTQRRWRWTRAEVAVRGDRWHMGERGGGSGRWEGGAWGLAGGA
jgi:hypothetical protein